MLRRKEEARIYHWYATAEHFRRWGVDHPTRANRLASSSKGDSPTGITASFVRESGRGRPVRRPRRLAAVSSPRADRGRTSDRGRTWGEPGGLTMLGRFRRARSHLAWGSCSRWRPSLTAWLASMAEDTRSPIAVQAEQKNVEASSIESDEPTTFVEQPGFTSAEPAPIWSVAFSPDGQRIAAGTQGGGNRPGELRIWDLATGREVYRFVAPQPSAPSPIRPTARRSPPPGSTRSPGSATPPTARSGRAARAFRGDQRRRLLPRRQDPGDRRLGQDGQALGRRHGRSAEDARGHTDQVFGVAFSPDGKTLASAAGTGPSALGRRDGQGEGDPPGASTGSSSRVAFAPDGKTVATAGWDGTVRLWDAATGQELADARGARRPGPRRRLLARRQDPRLVERRWGDDRRPRAAPGVVKLWDVASRKELATLAGQPTASSRSPSRPTARRSPRGASTGRSSSGTSRRTEAKGTLPRRSRPGRGAAGRSWPWPTRPTARPSPSAGEDRTIRLRDVATGRRSATLPGHDDVVACPGVLARRQDARLGRLRQDRPALGRRRGPRERRRSRGTRTGSSPWPSRPTARPWPRAATTRPSSSGTSPSGEELATLEGHTAAVRAGRLLARRQDPRLGQRRPDGQALGRRRARRSGRR